MKVTIFQKQQLYKERTGYHVGSAPAREALWLAENHREMGQDAVFLKM